MFHQAFKVQTFLLNHQQVFLLGTILSLLKAVRDEIYWSSLLTSLHFRWPRLINKYETCTQKARRNEFGTEKTMIIPSTAILEKTFSGWPCISVDQPRFIPANRRECAVWFAKTKVKLAHNLFNFTKKLGICSYQKKFASRHYQRIRPSFAFAFSISSLFIHPIRLFIPAGQFYGKDDWETVSLVNNVVSLTTVQDACRSAPNT